MEERHGKLIRRVESGHFSDMTVEVVMTSGSRALLITSKVVSIWANDEPIGGPTLAQYLVLGDKVTSLYAIDQLINGMFLDQVDDQRETL